MRQAKRVISAPELPTESAEAASTIASQFSAFAAQSYILYHFAFVVSESAPPITLLYLVFYQQSISGGICPKTVITGVALGMKL